jgi:predicted NBD/HSP70 family sugar kinase
LFFKKLNNILKIYSELIMYIVLDIGGTNCRIGFFNDLKSSKPFKVEYIKLQHDFDKDWQAILDTIGHLSTVNGAVMAIAGALSKDRTNLVNSPHLAVFEGINIKNRLSDDLSCPVEIFNDTYLAALGESTVARYAESFWYLNWGSGIGGSFVRGKGSSKKIYAAEPGHMIVHPGADICECGQRGCWDAMAGGKALERRYGKKPSELLLKQWKEVIPFMINGLINVAVTCPTELIILGGGIALNQPEIVDLISHKFQESMKIMSAPRLELAKLGDLAAIYGGFAFMREEYNERKF